MGRPFAETVRSGRVAVLGAPAEAGVRLREALAESGVPGTRVDLYGLTAGESMPGEYDGEARMIQEPDLTEVAGHALIFVCAEGRATLGSLVAALPAQAAVIDLAGALPDGLRTSPLRLEAEAEAEVEDEPPADATRCACYAVAHPLALLLGEFLLPLERRFGVDEASAVVLRPASDFGLRGADELREQTVRLLNFSSVPTETFGRQLAFNLIPHSDLAVEGPDLPRRIAGEVAELLSWPRPRLALKLIVAPLFYGHAVQLRLRLHGAPSRDGVREALEEAGLLGTADGRVPTTPMDVVGEVRAALTDLSEDGLGAFWIWGVAGEAGSRAARQAVRLASRLGRL